MANKPKSKRNGELRCAPPFWPFDKETLAGLDAAQRAHLGDVSLAHQLLTGIPMMDGKGEVRTLKHIEPGTEREREARAALSRVLRQRAPLDRFIRNHLARLIDPDGGSAQELVLKPRAAGHSADHLRDVHIAAGMADEVAAGASVTAAVESAMRLHGISIATAKRVWSEHGKPRLGGKTI